MSIQHSVDVSISNKPPSTLQVEVASSSLVGPVISPQPPPSSSSNSLIKGIGSNPIVTASSTTSFQLRRHSVHLYSETSSEGEEPERIIKAPSLRALQQCSDVNTSISPITLHSRCSSSSSRKSKFAQPSSQVTRDPSGKREILSPPLTTST